MYSLNQRPFGSGDWFYKKAETLAHFLDTHSSASPTFREFAPYIAEDLGLPCQTDDDYDAIWPRLPETESFVRKGVQPKAMRWFSVNDMWCRGKAELFTLKMVLEHYVGSSDAPVGEGTEDPAVAMQADPRKDSER